MVNDDKIKRAKLLSEEDYLAKIEEHGDDFSASMAPRAFARCCAQSTSPSKSTP